MDQAIRLVDVSKIFKLQATEVIGLRSVHLQIPFGSKIAITGKSGSGKSTLLHIIGTLDQPTSGEIFFGTTSIARLNDRHLSSLRSHKIGFVFQMNNLLPEFSALENVFMPAIIAGKDRSKSIERAKSLLASVQLDHRMSHRPGELSGGEQQRVAIARALMMEPLLLLADEPTGNLDFKTSQEIQGLLLKLADIHTMTMVVVTHDQDLAKKFPNQIVMQDGGVETIHGGGGVYATN